MRRLVSTLILLVLMLLASIPFEHVSTSSSLNGQWLCVQGSGAPSEYGDYYSTSDGANTYYSFYIEVPPGTSVLDIDIFDPDVGLGGSAEESANRDRRRGFSWDTSTKFTLYDPSGAQVTSITADSSGPSGSDGVWWDFYQVSNPSSGVWELRVDSSSAVTSGDDINYFGLRANGLNIYFYRASVGTNPSQSRKYDLYLYVHQGCQFSIREWDWDTDASGSQGYIRVTSPSGSFSDEFDDTELSNNAAWNSHTISGWTQDTESDDYGLWHLEVNITYYGSGGNYGVVEAYDYDGNPIKIYLPTDSGEAPPKPILSKSYITVSGPDPPRVGITSTFEVRVRISNPTSLTLNNVAVVDYVSSDVTWQDSLTTTAGSATYDSVNRRIDWSVGSLSAGSYAEMRYRVSITPSSSSQFSINMPPGPQGTKATYTSPITGSSETVGPICNLKTRAYPIYKQLYLRNGYSLKTQEGTSSLSESISNGGSASWTQSPPFASDLIVSDDITVNLYIVPHPGWFFVYLYPDVRVSLTYDGSPVYSDTINDITSAGWYTFTISGISSIPSGDAITLKVEVLTESGFTTPWIEVYYNSQTYNSRIEIPTSTFVNLEWVKTYDQTNTEKSTFNPGETVVVKANVTDPFGSGDIVGAWVTIYFPNNTKAVNNQTMTLETTDPSSPSLYKIFRYDYPLSSTAPTGEYLVVVLSKETNGVSHCGSTTFTVVVGGVEFKPNQTFSAAAGSNVSYNVYLINTGSSDDVFDLQGSSNLSVGVDIWVDTDWMDGGDTHIAYDADGDGVWDSVYSDSNSNGEPDISVSSGASATLIVTIILPSSASGTVQVNLTATGSGSGAHDFVLISTIIDNYLAWPSDWYQFGSDPIDDVSPPAVDDKSFYTVNNGTHVFFRLAEAATPSTVSYRYEVYMDTRTGGQNIGNYTYNYKLSSDGNLYNWTGSSWQVVSTTYVQVSGTSIVIGANLSDMVFEDQDVHILVRTYEGTVLKDEKGPYTTTRTFIFEMPLFIVPIATILLLVYISKKRSK